VLIKIQYVDTIEEIILAKLNRISLI